MLSRAAIVAREHAIPAVLGIPAATSRLRDTARMPASRSRPVSRRPERRRGPDPPDCGPHPSGCGP
ncbi:PEP-utilizing enzyme [Microbispora sp. H10670]|uniref:PEP-utilizing enzyme n=1 Tax=Microbispora sp. H10670 TaxID=2729108 RepID=UPI001C7265A3